jgi:hypothetical protein
MKDLKLKLLKAFLIVAGLVQLFYWGFSHLFYYQWYLGAVGMHELAQAPGKALIFMHEIGVLTIGMGLASILASLNPAKNLYLIVSLLVVSIGSMAISIYHVFFMGVTTGELQTVFVIALQIAILVYLYPWKEAWENR